MDSRFALVALVIALAPLASACQKNIGDSCSQNIQCSLNADRTCDITQPGGYCTMADCDPNQCPDNALCVEFDSNIPRLARRYCVESCLVDSNCGNGDVCLEVVAQCPADAGATSSVQNIPNPPMSAGDAGMYATSSRCSRVLDTTIPGVPLADGGTVGGAQRLGFCAAPATY